MSLLQAKHMIVMIVMNLNTQNVWVRRPILLWAVNCLVTSLFQIRSVNFLVQFYEGIKPIPFKMLTNKYSIHWIHCIIFYWKRLLMQMMQRVTSDHVPSEGVGWWCIYYRCDCHQQHRYQLLWAEARVTDHVCSMNAGRCPGSMLL